MVNMIKFNLSSCLGPQYDDAADDFRILTLPFPASLPFGAQDLAGVDAAPRHSGNDQKKGGQ